MFPAITQYITRHPNAFITLYISCYITEILITFWTVYLYFFSPYNDFWHNRDIAYLKKRWHRNATLWPSKRIYVQMPEDHRLKKLNFLAQRKFGQTRYMAFKNNT